MENIRIQDDLYTYVNQKKLDELVIPDDKPVAGGFNELNDSVEKIMMGEFETLAQTKEFRDMPIWPARDSVQVFGDTVVVKLSEIEYQTVQP